MMIIGKIYTDKNMKKPIGVWWMIRQELIEEDESFNLSWLAALGALLGSVFSRLLSFIDVMDLLENVSAT